MAVYLLSLLSMLVDWTLLMCTWVYSGRLTLIPSNFYLLSVHDPVLNIYQHRFNCIVLPSVNLLYNLRIWRVFLWFWDSFWQSAIVYKLTLHFLFSVFLFFLSCQIFFPSFSLTVIKVTWCVFVFRFIIGMTYTNSWSLAVFGLKLVITVATSSTACQFLHFVFHFCRVNYCLSGYLIPHFLFLTFHFEHHMVVLIIVLELFSC